MQPEIIYLFNDTQSARDYRHEHGTGGWIFEPEDNGKVALFPPYLAPSDIFRHPVARGRSGRLIGAQ